MLLPSSSHCSVTSTSTSRSVLTTGSKPPLPTVTRGTPRQCHAFIMSDEYEDKPRTPTRLVDRSRSASPGYENDLSIGSRESSSHHRTQATYSAAGHKTIERPSDFPNSPSSVSSTKMPWKVKTLMTTTATSIRRSVPFCEPRRDCNTPPRNRASSADMDSYDSEDMAFIRDVSDVSTDVCLLTPNLEALIDFRLRGDQSDLGKDTSALEDGKSQAPNTEAFTTSSSGGSSTKGRKTVSRQNSDASLSIPEVTSSVSKGDTNKSNHDNKIYETPTRNKNNHIFKPCASNLQMIHSTGLLDASVPDFGASCSSIQLSSKDGPLILETIRPLGGGRRPPPRRQIDRSTSAPTRRLPPSPSQAKRWSKETLIGSMGQLPPAFRTSKKIGTPRSPEGRRHIDVSKLEKVVHVKNRKDFASAKKLKRKWPPVERKKEDLLDCISKILPTRVIPMDAVRTTKSYFEGSLSRASFCPEKVAGPPCWTRKVPLQKNQSLELSPGSAVSEMTNMFDISLSEITDMIDTSLHGGARLDQTSLKIHWAGPTYFKVNGRPAFFNDMFYDGQGNEMPFANLVETRMGAAAVDKNAMRHCRTPRYYDGSDDENKCEQEKRTTSGQASKRRDTADTSYRGNIQGYNRPDVWVAPELNGTSHGTQKWRLRRVWRIPDVDDHEEDHEEVDESNLLEKVKELLGVPEENLHDQVHGTSSMYDPKMSDWKTKKVYDVDGLILRESKSQNVNEQGLITAFREISMEARILPATPQLLFDDETNGIKERGMTERSKPELKESTHSIATGTCASNGTGASVESEQPGADGRWIVKKGKLQMGCEDDWSTDEYTKEATEDGPVAKADGRWILNDGDAQLGVDESWEAQDEIDSGTNKVAHPARGKWVVDDSDEKLVDGDVWDGREEVLNPPGNAESPKQTTGKWVVTDGDGKHLCNDAWDVKEEKRQYPCRDDTKKTPKKKDKKKSKRKADDGSSIFDLLSPPAVRHVVIEYY